ncbi:DUF2244 domain-containing protein [Pseudohoeflea coraliihabitans]|uniref:DUF2244 domain-containing protein n=1 Tax=Pseudohoeflea coraliihabitans TaxID=2860393 RepID=A0ABS6WPH9_9HYPH|nr:DUF2244 domain-containing protein [Pseudohoeflea sp. DP4N28-3]MBW3097670.1 DUF2244 domain-containing protein [Pseudohoeflea sp. DP4N28-3]
MTDKPVFEAVLSPYRSLGRAGLAVLVVLTFAVTIFHLVVFVAAGAWPVAGFFGLDLVLLYGAFWLNGRAGRAREYVRVSPTQVLVEKLTPSGRRSAFRCNPFWARFSVERHEEIGIVAMRVSERHQGGTAIGAFLNPEDKESFAAAFSSALARVHGR